MKLRIITYQNPIWSGSPSNERSKNHDDIEPQDLYTYDCQDANEPLKDPYNSCRDQVLIEIPNLNAKQLEHFKNQFVSEAYLLASSKKLLLDRCDFDCIVAKIFNKDKIAGFYSQATGLTLAESFSGAKKSTQHPEQNHAENIKVYLKN